MRRSQIHEGFYWVDRVHLGMTIGEVRRTRCAKPNDELYVVFPGSSTCYHIGIPDEGRPTCVEARRFKGAVYQMEKHPYSEGVKKKPDCEGAD